MTDPLIEFLNARYDEAEAIARAAGGDGPEGQWARRKDEAGDEYGHLRDGDESVVVYDEGSPGGAEFDHIALHDPAATLRGIVGKRKIVAMAEGQDGYHLPDGVRDGRDPDERECDDVLRLTLFEVLRNLAEEFATHPEYRAKDWGQWPTP